MGKKETFEAVLERMKENGPLMMREMLKLLTTAAVEGAGGNVTRNELLAAAHMVSKEATKTAMAWSGEINKEDALLLLNVLLQAVSAFVTVCHGFTAGAGQTLLAAIRTTATDVVESAAQLMEGCIELVQRGAPNDEKATVLPKLAGRVWETCEAVKKAPTSNQVAVGRGLALLAATVKDTLREMGEMKETSQVAELKETAKVGATKDTANIERRDATNARGGKCDTAGGANGSARKTEKSEAAVTGSKEASGIGSNEASRTGSNTASGIGSNGASCTGSNGASGTGSGVSGLRNDGVAGVGTGEALHSAREESASTASVLGDSLRGLRLAGASKNGRLPDLSESDCVSNREMSSGVVSNENIPSARLDSHSTGRLVSESAVSEASEKQRESLERAGTSISHEGLRKHSSGRKEKATESHAEIKTETKTETETETEMEKQTGTGKQTGTIKEKEPATENQTEDSQKEGRVKVGNEGRAVSLPDDLGDMAEILDYNPEFDAEDMELVRAAVLVAETVLTLLKQLLYVVAKWAPPEDWSKDAALNVLEMLHGDCSDICLQIEELGACLYPPQEIDSLIERTTHIEEKVNTVDDIVHEAIEGGPSASCKDAIAAALQACQDLKQLIAEGLEADSDD